MDNFLTEGLKLDNAQEVESKEATLPTINQPAPDFTAPTNQGEIPSSNYRGQWRMLFSYPSDFTLVCTTELIFFSRNYDKFEALNTSLIGLSIDSIYSHIAWVRSIASL
jgi:peroxiredoxin (alkyl hydroperoxide reductase subunit C)